MKVTVCPSGGLANRMRAIMSGIALARDTGRDIEVIWARDRGLNAPYSSLFDPSRLEAPLIEISPFDYYLRYIVPRKKNLYLSRLWQRKHFAAAFFDEESFVRRFVEHPEALRKFVAGVDGDVYFFSGLEFYDYDADDYRRAFLPPSRRVLERADSFGATPQCTVGLHIRRTDNANSIASSPLALFEDAMERELAADPSVCFYLASDDNSVKAALAARFGDKVVFNPWQARRDTPQGIVDALAEMIVLSRTRRIYGSYFSTYSVAAATLGQVPLQVLSAK